jgi:hypothetical protein
LGEINHLQSIKEKNMSIDPETARIGLEGMIASIKFLSDKASPKIKEQIVKWKTKGNAEKLRINIRQIGNISTIASKKTSTIDDIYFPAKITVAKSTSKLITHAAELFANKCRISLILGTAGQGKSVFLRYLCLRDLDVEGKIPLFIELRRIDKDKNLKSLLQDHIKILGIGEEDTVETLKLLLASGKSRLFLDGYDEISREYSLRTKSEINQLLSENKELEVAITSRPGAISQHLKDSFDIAQYEIAPVLSADHSAFFSRIGVEQETKARLLSAIGRGKAEIRNLLSTPLMLTLLVITCGAQQDLPDTLPEFYDSLFNVLSSTHDGSKPGYARQKATNLGNAELERLFCAFSFTSKTLFKKNSLTHRQLEKALDHAKKISDSTCTLDGFKTEITETVCLMINDGLDIAFIHKSIQEYYAARFIHTLEDKSHAQRILEHIEQNSIFEWGNELQFLEDFRDRTYENVIGITHALKLTSELQVKSRKNQISWVKLKKFIERTKISVGRYRESKQISSISWPLVRDAVNYNRYSMSLTSDLTAAAFRVARVRNKPPSLSDSLEVIQLTDLAKQDIHLKNALLQATQKFCEGLDKKRKAMTERQSRQDIGLLSILN